MPIGIDISGIFPGMSQSAGGYTPNFTPAVHMDHDLSKGIRNPDGPFSTQ